MKGEDVTFNLAFDMGGTPLAISYVGKLKGDTLTMKSTFSMGDGAPVKRSRPDCVLGNAMTSRMFSSPARMATSRSRPNATPAWGGAPYLKASRRKPKRRWASSSSPSNPIYTLSGARRESRATPEWPFCPW